MNGQNELVDSLDDGLWEVPFLAVDQQEAAVEGEDGPVFRGQHGAEGDGVGDGLLPFAGGEFLEGGKVLEALIDL